MWLKTRRGRLVNLAQAFAIRGQAGSGGLLAEFAGAVVEHLTQAGDAEDSALILQAIADGKRWLDLNAAPSGTTPRSGGTPLR